MSHDMNRRWTLPVIRNGSPDSLETHAGNGPTGSVREEERETGPDLTANDRQHARRARERVFMQPASPFTQMNRSVGFGNNRVGRITGGLAIRGSRDGSAMQLNVTRRGLSVEAIGDGPDDIPRTVRMGGQRKEGGRLLVRDHSPTSGEVRHERETTVPVMTNGPSFIYRDTATFRGPQRRSTTNTFELGHQNAQRRTSVALSQSSSHHDENGEHTQSHRYGGDFSPHDVNVFDTLAGTAPAIPATPFIAGAHGEEATPARPAVRATSFSLNNSGQLNHNGVRVRSDLESAGYGNSNYGNASAELNLSRQDRNLNGEFMGTAAFSTTEGIHTEESLYTTQLEARGDGRHVSFARASAMASNRDRLTNIAGLGIDRMAENTHGFTATSVRGDQGRRNTFTPFNSRETSTHFEPVPDSASESGTDTEEEALPQQRRR